MKISGLIAAMFLIVGTCQADAVLANLPGTAPYNGDVATLGASVWVAVGVETGSTEVQFTSLEGEFASGSPATLTGGIYSDSLGAPGSIVGTFGSESIGGTSESTEGFTETDNIIAFSTSETFTTAGTVDLQANTNYWFVIEDAPQGVAWLSDSSNSGAGTAPLAKNGSGFTFLSYQSTSNSGGNWTPLGAGNPTIEIDATSVSAPEPASIFLLSCGCACLIVSCRLRRVR